MFLLRMQPEPCAEQPEGFEELRESTRTRRCMVEERTDDKNRLHKMLRYDFPGYRKQLSSVSARQYNPSMSACYKRLRKRGKSMRAAGGAIARKLAELVFTLLKRKERWSAEKARQGLEQAEQMLEQAEQMLEQAEQKLEAARA